MDSLNPDSGTPVRGIKGMTQSLPVVLDVLMGDAPQVFKK